MAPHRWVTRRAFAMGGATAVALVARVASADDPATRVLLVGSSMMAGAFGRFLGTELETHGWQARRQVRSASGLARPDFYNWPAVVAPIHEEFRPHVTVVLFGGNDAQSLRQRDAEPKWIYWDDERWIETYGQRVSAFADLVTGNGGRVVWVGAPIMRPSKLDRRMQRINRIYRAEMAIRANASFVGTRDVLADDTGKYTDHLLVDGKKQRVRAHDGVHVTGKGARILVDHVAPAVLEFMGDPVDLDASGSDHACVGPRFRPRIYG